MYLRLGIVRTIDWSGSISGSGHSWSSWLQIIIDGHSGYITNKTQTSYQKPASGGPGRVCAGWLDGGWNGLCNIDLYGGSTRISLLTPKQKVNLTECLMDTWLLSGFTEVAQFQLFVVPLHVEEFIEPFPITTAFYQCVSSLGNRLNIDITPSLLFENQKNQKH